MLAGHGVVGLAGRVARRAALALVTVVSVGCDNVRESLPAEQWSVREVRRTPLTSAIAEEEIVDVEWATDSTLLVAIDGGRQLVLLNWDGTLQRRVSRRGSGPGETHSLLDDSARVITQAAFDSRPRVPDISCGYCPSAVSADGIIAMATSDTSYRILRTRLDSVVLPAIERPELPSVALSAAEADSIAARWEDFAQRMVARGASDEIVTRLKEMGGQSRFKKRFPGRGLEFDESASLWVQINVADGDSAAVHVFGADARLTGEFRLPQGMVMRRVRDGVVLATAVLETGETVAVEYVVTDELS